MLELLILSYICVFIKGCKNFWGRMKKPIETKKWFSPATENFTLFLLVLIFEDAYYSDGSGSFQ
jgi:hypothetical protein